MDRNHSLKHQQPKWRLIKKEKEANKQTNKQMSVNNVLKVYFRLNWDGKSDVLLRPLNNGKYLKFLSFVAVSGFSSLPD